MMNLKPKEETPAGGLHNVLSSGSAIKGNVMADTDFRLDGKVEGDILCGKLKASIMQSSWQSKKRKFMPLRTWSF